MKTICEMVFDSAPEIELSHGDIWIGYTGGGYSTVAHSFGNYVLSLGSGNRHDDQRPIGILEHKSVRIIFSNQELCTFLLNWTNRTDEMLHEVFIQFMGFIAYHKPEIAYEIFVKSVDKANRTGFTDGQEDIRSKFRELMQFGDE